jgi:hypothetical protein
MSTVFKRWSAASLSADGTSSSISSAASIYQQPSCAIAAVWLTDEATKGDTAFANLRVALRQLQVLRE